MRHLELFSGIGGFRRAMDLLTQDGIMPFECVGYSEIDEKAAKTYVTNFHPTDNEVVIGDIVSFTSDVRNIKNLPDFELLSGGFPCQTFSMMGGQAGFNEARGQMFFRIMDIVNVKHPRYLLLENVKNLYTHDHGNTYQTIYNELHNAGYKVVTNIFDTEFFMLPQKRNRVIIFATMDNIDETAVQAQFTLENVSQTFNEHIRDIHTLKYRSITTLLSQKVDQKYFLSERIKPTILSNGSGGFISRSDINQRIARPLTATMHKMHRACQDNYYSQDFIESKGRINPVDHMTKEQLAALPIRKLTPEEAFALQGFPRVFATNARKAGVADGALYKQAGNAVSVNTIYAVLFYLIKNNIINI